MRSPTAVNNQTDFHRRATFGLSVAIAVALVPITYIDFTTGNYRLGLMAVLLLAAGLFNIVSIARGHYSPGFNTYLVVPMAIICLLFAVKELGVPGVFWAYPLVLVIYSVLTERQAWVANGILILALFPVLMIHLETIETVRALLTITVVSVFSIVFTRVINGQRQLLAEQLLIDPLTKLYNRSSLDSTLLHTIALNNRSGVRMTLIAIDIDKFKQINDTKGHAAGDLVLIRVARILRENVRRSDYVFRMGGEEFLILLSGAGLQSGFMVAEKLRMLIQSCDFFPDDEVTASMGVATLENAESADDWLRRADEHLYAAKEAGRNKVISG